MTKKTFASDNYAGVHPEIMDALIQANKDHAAAYGADEYTARAIAQFKNYFGQDIEVFFVYNGTGANVLGLQSLVHSFNSILCAELAHINVDESTAPEKFIGCKLIPVASTHGKIFPAEIEQKIIRLKDQHHPQAKVISISQSTEYGAVYAIEEIKAIAALARKYNMFLHMDGSRLANASVSLKQDFAAFTRDAGVDVLSFGGTKNGMMFGEAVIFFNPSQAENFKYIRKQGMQLHSKMRFIGAQFERLLRDNLWKKTAAHSNAMAKYLEQQLLTISPIKITQPVEANVVFAIMPPPVITEVQKHYFFYVWNEQTSEVRLMCAFDTIKEEIDDFIEKVRSACLKYKESTTKHEITRD
jgi:threonine aldolase